MVNKWDKCHTTTFKKIKKCDGLVSKSYVVVISKSKSRGYNRMYDKFCIIDMDYVMHGSYNWTPTANKNVETLATALDHELVAKFAKEFMKLYKEIYF